MLPFFLVLLALPALAEHAPKPGDWSKETAPFRGQRVAKHVDLAKQFFEEVPTQGRAGTCSSYAAVGLMESACLRATKKMSPAPSRCNGLAVSHRW